MSYGRTLVLFIVAIVAGFLLFQACATSESSESSPADDDRAASDDHASEERAEGENGDDHSDHQKKEFKNPEERAQRWNSPERDAWQRPEAVIDAMAIENGMTVADVGAGTGYFVPYLAEAVGPEGRVLAVDIQQAMLDYIDELAAERGLEHVETVLAEKTDTNLEESSVDRILVVNTWHHIPDRRDYAEHLRKRLDDGGAVWVVDYTHDSPSGPPKKHRLEPQEVVEELEAGGFDAEVRDLKLDRQFVVVGHTE